MTTIQDAPVTLEDRLEESRRQQQHFATLHHRDATRARDFLNQAIDHGWSAVWNALTATSGAPYVTIKARRGDEEIRATWHTHKTGTWRWDDALYRGPTGGWRHLSSQKAAFTALERAGTDGEEG